MLADASKVISFKIDNKTDDIVNVNENRSVSVVCQAEGKPLPKLRLYKRGSKNQNITLSEDVEKLQYTINVVNCEDAYTYFCKSENNISSDERNIRLTVSCEYSRCYFTFYSRHSIFAKTSEKYYSILQVWVYF